ncbi:hypothetical protein V6N13_133804 [Hibiscus sabdariffa]
MALLDTRDSFWRKKHSDEKRTDIGLSQNHSDQRNAQKQYPKLPLKLVEGMVDGDKLDILQNYAIGFCRHPYRLRDLVKEFRDSKCEGFTVMQIVDTDVASSSGCKEVDDLKSMTFEVVAINSLNDAVVGDTFNDNSVDNTVLAKSAIILTPNSSLIERIWEGNKKEDPRVLGSTTPTSWMANEEIGLVTGPMDDRDNSDVMTLVSQDVPLHEQNVQELNLVDG